MPKFRPSSRRDGALLARHMGFAHHRLEQARQQGMATREEGKDSRRRLILRTARELIGGKGETSFSMRALSERAKLSSRTPYNLFGSKQAIMQALLDEDIQEFAETLPRVRRNELELFFEAVTHGTRAFAENPAYYRAVMAAVYQEGGRQYRSTFRGPRRIFWRLLVEDAIRAGYLSKEVKADPFSVNLAAIFFSHILEWVADEIDLEEVEARTHYGFGLALMALAKPSHRPALQDRVLKAQRKLTRRAANRQTAGARHATGAGRETV